MLKTPPVFLKHPCIFKSPGIQKGQGPFKKSPHNSFCIGSIMVSIYYYYCIRKEDNCRTVTQGSVRWVKAGVGGNDAGVSGG